MEFIVIGVLVLLVVHAAGKATVLQAAQSTGTNGAAPQNLGPLPPPSTVSFGSATSTPSPATAMGAPGAANSYQLLLDTNSPYADPSLPFYASGGAPSALQGVPLPFVAPKAQNGFNAVPAVTKTLSTWGAPARTQIVNPSNVVNPSTLKL